MKKAGLILAMVSCCLTAICQEGKVYTVNPGTIKAKIQSTMYGIFFEDINMGADGGLYAELVKNRSFEFAEPLMGWEIKNGSNGTAKVIDRASTRPDNPHVLQIAVSSATGGFGLVNSGFRGMGIKKGESYNFSVMAKQLAGSSVKLTVELHDGNKVIGTANVLPTSTTWKKYDLKIRSVASVNKGQLYVWLTGKGAIDLDMISLFPEHTWKNRPNGLRADLVQKLADMKPGFLRFPGGCIVEGRELATRYQWKKTIGDVDKRETVINRWNQEFKHRLTPDYFQSFGLGFMEYFMLAEDIGAEPLPILNCGMACQFNTAQVVDVDNLDPYVQDAVDLIEFANGGTDTKWGKLRASLGHPAKFNLKMMGVGNENWGPNYIERWKIFHQVLKQKYPEIKLVTSTGTDPDGARFDTLNTTFRGLKADILDEHYYRAPKWFLDHAKRYDNYDRSGPKIFAGEYAAQSVAIASPKNKNNWECALSEAAFMTGLERNADVVSMASYAPLFAHVDAWQWTPDLIWFDNQQSYGTPNYYVQKLYSLYKGTEVVSLLLNNEAITGQDGCYATASNDAKNSELIIKFINSSDKSLPLNFDISGLENYQKTATVITLKSNNLNAENSLQKPTAVIPVNSKLEITGKYLHLTAEPYSFKVIRLKLK